MRGSGRERRMTKRFLRVHEPSEASTSERRRATDDERTGYDGEGRARRHAQSRQSALRRRGDEAKISLQKESVSRRLEESEINENKDNR